MILIGLRKGGLGTLFLALALLVSRPALAVDAAAAEQVVRGVVADAGAAFAGGALSTDDKRARVSALVDRYADLGHISELLLGRYWRKATPEQRQTFTDLLIPFFVATYGGMIDDAKVRPDLVYRGNEPRDDAMIVHSQLITLGEEPVVVDWVIAASPAGKLGVVDVTADGISMVTTIRSDFTAVIRGAGGNVEALFDAMRKKVAGAEAPR